MTRAERRFKREIAINRAKRVIKHIWERHCMGASQFRPNTAQRLASVHCRPCSCWMCKERPPLNEKPNGVFLSAEGSKLNAAS